MKTISWTTMFVVGLIAWAAVEQGQIVFNEFKGVGGEWLKKQHDNIKDWWNKEPTPSGGGSERGGNTNEKGGNTNEKGGNDYPNTFPDPITGPSPIGPMTSDQYNNAMNGGTANAQKEGGDVNQTPNPSVESEAPAEQGTINMLKQSTRVLDKTNEIVEINDHTMAGGGKDSKKLVANNVHIDNINRVNKMKDSDHIPNIIHDMKQSNIIYVRA